MPSNFLLILLNALKNGAVRGSGHCGKQAHSAGLKIIANHLSLVIKQST